MTPTRMIAITLAAALTTSTAMAADVTLKLGHQANEEIYLKKSAD